MRLKQNKPLLRAVQPQPHSILRMFPSFCASEKESAMFFRLPIRQFGIVLLGLGMSFFSSSVNAQPRPTRININVTDNDVFLLVKIPRARYTWMTSRNWHPTVRLWLRLPTGWSQIGFKALQERQYTRAISRGRLCRNTYGKLKLVLQLGVRSGQNWWNRYTRTWQNEFSSIQQHVAYIPCAEVPDDWPPGSPAQAGTTVEPNPTEDLPPAQPTVPTTPTPPPTQPDPGQQPVEPPTQPEPPPAPAVVDDNTFQSFYQSMKETSFDNARYTTLRNWLSRLNQLKLKPSQVRSLISSFSFDSTRIKAGRIMSSHVLRPLQVADVIEIIRDFSFGSSKLKVALYYCQGLQDSINVHQLAKQFTFSTERRRIMAGCR